jgi:phage-related protein
VKGVFWMGSAREDIRAFPKDARQRAGYDLYQVQCGLDSSDWKPMPSVGSGVHEIRVHTRLEHRVIYIAKFEEGVYVPHAFEKKTHRTRKADIDLARSRLKDARGMRHGARQRPKG